MPFKGFVRLNERFLYYSTQVHHRSRQILYHPFKQSGRIMRYKCKNEQKSINTISDRSGRWWRVVKWEHHFSEKDPLMWLHCQKSHLWYLGDSAVWRVMLKTKGFHSFSLFIPFLLSRTHTLSLPTFCLLCGLAGDNVWTGMGECECAGGAQPSQQREMRMTGAFVLCWWKAILDPRSRTDRH